MGLRCGSSAGSRRSTALVGHHQFAFISVAQEDGDGVGEQGDDQQHDDGGRRQRAELLLRLLGPAGRRSVGSAVYGPVSSVDEPTAAGVENAPRTAPTRSSGAVSPSARASVRTVPVRMPGTAAGRTSLADHLPARGADAVAGLADACRDGAQRLGRRDDHDRQDEDGQRQAAGRVTFVPVAARRWPRRRRRRPPARAGRRRPTARRRGCGC